MTYNISSMHQLYQWRQKIEKLSERERALALLMVLALLIGLWYLAVYSRQLQAKKEMDAKIITVQAQIQTSEAKRAQLLALIQVPLTAELIGQYTRLLAELKSLETNMHNYQQHSIGEKDLSKLLHDILMKTTGVSILDFTTIENTVHLNQKPTEPSGLKTTQVMDNNLKHKNYRLVLKGSYFQIMLYLKRIEALNWKLYWDRFNYIVTDYPDAVATLEFYTLRPRIETISAPMNVPISGIPESVPSAVEEKLP